MTIATPSRSQPFVALIFCTLLTATAANVATAATEPGEARTTKADERTVALNACIDAFVRAKRLAGRPVVVRTAESPQPPIRIGNDYHVELSAVASRSRQFFGGARCVVRPNGAVVSLNGKPVNAGNADARLADR